MGETPKLRLGMAQATENLADSGIVDRTLKVGDRIPLILYYLTPETFNRIR